MLRITIELVPFGNEDEAKQIGQMVLANDASGDSTTGNYEAIIAPDAWTGAGERHVKLEGFNRRLGAWELVKKILQSADAEGEKSNLYKRLKARLK